MVYYVRPKVVEISAKKVVVKIPFRRRNKNHLGSMYFGAMAIGAELAAGLLAMKLIMESKQKIQMIFKQFSGNFIKRAEADTHFICKDGEKIEKLVSKAKKSNERVEESIQVYATVPDKLDDEVVAKFSLTISLKGK